MRLEKEPFIATAQWLEENTEKSDIICDNDGRIGFYAGRKTIEFTDNELNILIQLVVLRVDGEL